MAKNLSRRDVLKLMGTASASFFLSACGVPLETLTPTPLPTSTATKTITPFPTATASYTPTPDVNPEEKIAENLESKLDIIDYTEGTQDILNCVTRIELDSSLSASTQSFEIRPETVEIFISHLLYDAWVADGNQGEFEEFAEKLRLAQVGGSWNEAEIRVKTKNKGFVRIRPSQDKNAGEFHAEEIVISLVNSFRPQFEDLIKINETGLAFRVDLIDRKLRIYAAPYNGGNFVNQSAYAVNYNWAQVLSGISSILRTGRTSSSVNKTYINMLLDGGLNFQG